MQDATAGSQHPPTAGYSLQEAAVLLGIGVNTLRRRIATGQVRAEQIERPQGHVWRVYLNVESPSQQPPMQDAEQEAVGGSHTLPSEPAAPASIVQAEALTGLVQATVATVLGPLVAELAASRQVNTQMAQEIADLREDRGRLTAERDAVQTQIASILAAQTVTPPVDSPVSFWRRWWPAALALVALLLSGVALVWPR